MPGLIRRNDIDEVRARVNIVDVVGDYVTLKTAGVGSLKGLCPFHDERSPSFHVRPQVGRYHCFGCGEDGDVFTFLQKMDSTTFTEAVERMAARVGVELHYEDGGQANLEHGNRARILAANEAAAQYFTSQLGSAEAEVGRVFLGQRGFDAVAAQRFGVGFAPKSFDALKGHLGSLGYTEAELVTAGLLSQGDRGAYDRFRGRLVWPIRDVTGQALGFGARRLLEDDKGPKYLNTPETPVYHKSSVLYGLDLAKRDISRGKQVVVVEGYTDVMACHLAGVTTAVATCGTSFGVDHIKVVRRVLGDVDNVDTRGLGEVVFTFDPDEAGQKAASRAFSEEQRFAAQTFVAVAPEGLDPCDLRLKRGDDAVRRLIRTKKPMFEFMIRRVLDAHDLDTVEGRVAGLRAAAPILAGIRDQAMSGGYAHNVARWLGMDPAEVTAAVRAAIARVESDRRSTTARARQQGANQQGASQHSTNQESTNQQSTNQQASGNRPQPESRTSASPTGATQQHPPSSGDGAGQGEGAQSTEAPQASRQSPSTRYPQPAQDSLPTERLASITDLPADLATRLERDALMAMLQHPESVDRDLALRASHVAFSNASLAVVRDGIAGSMDAWASPTWLDRVIDEVPRPFAQLVQELGVAPIPIQPGKELAVYCTGVTVALIDRDLLRKKGELLGRLQRMDSGADAAGSREVQRELMRIEQERRVLRDE